MSLEILPCLVRCAEDTIEVNLGIPIKFIPQILRLLKFNAVV